MRVFIAVVPPAETQAAVAAVSSSLRCPGDRVSWVREHNLHFTLRFLGEIEEAAANRAATATAEAAAAHRPISVALGKIGGFPDQTRARVLWLGLTRGERELTALAVTLEQRLEAHGFARSDREFSLHLTIGRMREPRPVASAALLTLGLEARPGLAFEVRELCVIESVLSPGGSRYSVRFRGDLAD